MDLGTTSSMGEPMPTDKAEKHYPYLRLEGDQVDQFLKMCKSCKKGEEVKVDATLRVCGFSDHKYGKSLEFEVIDVCCEECDEHEEEHKPDYADYAKGLIGT